MSLLINSALKLYLFILSESSFRQGKMYHYDIANLESKALQDFASGWYKNVHAKNVPVPKSPL